MLEGDREKGERSGRVKDQREDGCGRQTENMKSTTMYIVKLHRHPASFIHATSQVDIAELYVVAVESVLVIEP